MLTEYNKYPASQVKKEKPFILSSSLRLRQLKKKNLTPLQESFYDLQYDLNHDLLNSDIRVFNAIIFYHNLFLQVMPSIETISRKAGVCRNTVIASLKRLRIKGLLKIITRYRRTSIYCISGIFQHLEIRKILSQLFNNLCWWKDKLVDSLRSVPVAIRNKFTYFSKYSCPFWTLYKYTHLRSYIYRNSCSSCVLNNNNNKHNFEVEKKTTTATEKKGIENRKLDDIKPQIISPFREELINEIKSIFKKEVKCEEIDNLCLNLKTRVLKKALSNYEAGMDWFTFFVALF